MVEGLPQDAKISEIKSFFEGSLESETKTDPSERKGYKKLIKKTFI